MYKSNEYKVRNSVAAAILAVMITITSLVVTAAPFEAVAQTVASAPIATKLA